jgi:Skp family chaperone for outer membrane proteins
VGRARAHGIGKKGSRKRHPAVAHERDACAHLEAKTETNIGKKKHRGRSNRRNKRKKIRKKRERERNKHVNKKRERNKKRKKKKKEGVWTEILPYLTNRERVIQAATASQRSPPLHTKLHYA